MTRKEFLLGFVFICCLFVLPSCQKIGESFTGADTSKVLAVDPEENEKIELSGVTAVLFAYNYNSPEFVKDCLDYLDQKFGLEKNGGAIRPIIYPDDFQKANRIRISYIRDYVRDTNVNALITFGAPEDTAAALTVLRDQGWKTPVYSLFPQDELLPVEYVSSFVLENDDLQRQVDADALFLLTSRLVQYAQSAEELTATTIKNALQSVVGFDWQVLPYTDTETGIRPANHFVLHSVADARYGTVK